MRFGQVSPADAVGAILVHSVRADGIAFKKGRLLTAEDAAALERAGIGLVTSARLEDGDVGEDAARGRVYLPAELLSNFGVSAAQVREGALTPQYAALMRFLIDLADVGNTVSSTIPIALSRAKARGDLPEGTRSLLLGFGVGLAWSGAIVDW